MAIQITLVISTLAILGSRILFRQWVNHVSIYSFIWTVMIVLYEWKLLPYFDTIPLSWFLIASTFLSFLFGVLTITSVKNLFSINQTSIRQSCLNLRIFQDNGRTIKYAIILFSGITIYAGIQHWMVLVDMFGSIPSAIINTNIIYKFNSLGGLKGVIPFISNFGFAAVFLSAIYTAYKGRFSFLTFLPFIGIVIKSLATVGRVGMLFALIEFFLTFILFRYLLNSDPFKRFKFSKRNAIVAFSILVVFIVTSASLVRVARVGTDKFPGASKELRELQDNFIITPTIYFYLSSNIGVLNQYLKSDGEKTKFGENTFWLLHYYLAKYDIIKKPSDLQKGYYIPMWTNNGTYIRELYADFGVVGVFFVPYLLGMFITWLWLKFYQQHGIIIFALLIFFNLIISFSFLSIITRLDIWGVSLLIIILSIPVLERIAIMKGNKSYIT